MERFLQKQKLQNINTETLSLYFPSIFKLNRYSISKKQRSEGMLRMEQIDNLHIIGSVVRLYKTMSDQEINHHSSAVCLELFSHHNFFQLVNAHQLETCKKQGWVTLLRVKWGGVNLYFQLSLLRFLKVMVKVAIFAHFDDKNNDDIFFITTRNNTKIITLFSSRRTEAIMRNLSY